MAHDSSTTKGKIAIMQAAESGKPLQRRYRDGNSEWSDTQVNPTWDWLNNDFRIRPAPREFAIYEAPDGRIHCTPWDHSWHGHAIHVREVQS